MCGGTKAQSGAVPAGRVYPRVCGGTNGAPGTPGFTRGLSPRVRGNPGPAIRPNDGPGSIPACAGEPGNRTLEEFLAGVYPRVCGGTFGYDVTDVQKVSLSPRVRGNPSFTPIVPDGMKSIPACAGEPVIRDAGAAVPEVYPRVCGGTSIPACAGEPRRPLLLCECAEVYPRVCGGTPEGDE